METLAGAASGQFRKSEHQEGARRLQLSASDEGKDPGTCGRSVVADDDGGSDWQV